MGFFLDLVGFFEIVWIRILNLLSRCFSLNPLKPLSKSEVPSILSTEEGLSEFTVGIEGFTFFLCRFSYRCLFAFLQASFFLSPLSSP